MDPPIGQMIDIPPHYAPNVDDHNTRYENKTLEDSKEILLSFLNQLELFLGKELHYPINIFNR